MGNKQETGTEHIAIAKAMNLPVSTKHGVEISNFLRYKKTSFAKRFLEDVIQLKKPVPFKKFNRDVGHKPGMAAGRYPQKAAKEFLSLIKSVEANAQMKGLNTSNLKITKLLANKASLPMTGGRQRRGTKRTHLEVEVKEVATLKKDDLKKVEKSVEKKVETQVDEKKVEVKEEQPVVEEQKEVVEEKVEPVVEEKVQEEVKEIIVKPEEHKEIIVEEKKETDLVKEEPVEKEVIVKPEEHKEIIVEEKKETELVKEEPKVEEKVEPVAEVVKEKVEEVKAEVLPEIEKIKEPSSKELLAMAQKKAAELNKKEKRDESVQEVENLYEQLKKKGSLRDKGGKK
ncbi:MAG: 50S ribosomal protein L22 [Nanoarchaeota archaeon]|nr:50S ribosomal protein L22 [Nanoarchaeota archaeon]MBU1622635.1 50S ribosomal protein L22 [Nanoarchaeota archaeon]MBU1974279.1 50S ribosomal protein L22 [Nanoarchaeota archaeon]